MPRGSAAIACFIVVLASFSLRPARAAEVPSSALSVSSAIPPILLDYPSLAFLFPQTAADYQPQVLALGLFEGAGVLAGAKRSTFFAFVQSPNDDPIDSDGYPRSSMLQAGWSARWPSIRVGLAVRGSKRSDDLQTKTVFEEDWDDRMARDHGSALEGAAGFGIRRANVALDAEFSLRRFDRIAGSGYASPNSWGADTVAVLLETDGDWSPEAAVRARVRFSGNLLLTAAGQWNETRLGWDGWYVRIDEEESDYARLRFDDFGRRWMAAIAVAAPLRRIDQVVVSASHTESDNPLTTAESDGFIRYRNHNSRSTAAFSLRHEFDYGIGAHAGLESAYLTERTKRRWKEESPRFRVESTKREYFQHDFSWGATYSWRNFRFAGEVSHSLSLSNLFGMVDARILF